MVPFSEIFVAVDSLDHIQMHHSLKAESLNSRRRDLDNPGGHVKVRASINVSIALKNIVPFKSNLGIEQVSHFELFLRVVVAGHASHFHLLDGIGIPANRCSGLLALLGCAPKMQLNISWSLQDVMNK